MKALSPIELISIKLGDALFTPLSALLHTIWFAVWLGFGLSINLLTLVVSLEAIYITLFIGLGQNLGARRDKILADKAHEATMHAEAHRTEVAEQQQRLLQEVLSKLDRLAAEQHR